MSRAVKRKHFQKQWLEEECSLPTEVQAIGKALMIPGNNLVQIQTSDNDVFLVSVPTKFRKALWVKRGDYILFERIAEGNKVKGEMVRYLSPDLIKYYKENNCWPECFNDKNEKRVNDKLSKGSESDEDDLFVNPNRPPPSSSDDDEEDSSDNSTESDTDDE